MSIHRPIPSAPGYFATRTGEIVSMSGWRGLVQRKLEQSMSGNKRYLVVRPTIDGKRVTKNVHSLIAEAFHGPRPRGMVCRHLDGDARNNRPENIRYGTALENARDRQRHGTQATGEKCISNAKLTPDQVIEIRDRAAQGARAADLAEEFGISRNHVATIVRRATWKHVA